MTFFLTKVKLAHLCREWTDTVPLDTSKLMQISYEHIIALDEKLKDFFSDLPFFFKVDAGSRRQSRPLETVYPKISIMRYCITAAAHSRRCRLHQKFLLRQSSDPRYAYSRQACLESARAVIQVYDDRQEDGDPPSIAKARMGMAVHYTHLALVVMVMDLCFNKDKADHEQRKVEVRTALQMLEGARNISPLLGRSLDSLWEILWKHEVPLIDMASSTTKYATAPSEYPADYSQDLLEDVDLLSARFEAGVHDPMVGVDTSFDEFWQLAGETTTDIDLVSWDKLFSALDSRPF